MTVAELDRWTIKKNWGEKRKQELERYLRKYIIYPYNRALCLKWAEVINETEIKGTPVGYGDAWIAATALLLDIPLVTNNGKDFNNIDGLTLISGAYSS